MPIDLTKTSLEPQHNQALLKDLQGNILNGHDRDHAIHIFIKFHLGSAKATKDWLQTFAEKITSAWQQWEETSTLSNNSASNNSASEKCFTSFLLSAHGYESLGFDLKPTDNENNVLFDDAFRAGMRVFRNWLSDPAIEEWEQNYQNQIDAVIILANNDLANLRQETEQLKLAINQVAEIITIETGRVLKNEHGQIIENFGFVDGISQPFIYEK
ncbi:peroxidase [Beggiatoa sp. PS]|nr:peroxidase [Beggiatoa sp. PS]